MSSHASITLRLIVMCLSLVLLAACSTKQIPIAPEVMKELNPSTPVTLVHYDPEPFMIWTGEQKARSAFLMLFGAIGGAIEGGMQVADAKETGAKFISQTQLTDPIGQVESRFLSAWLPELMLKNPGTSQRVGDDDVKTLHKKFGNGYALDFKTEGWMIQLMPQTAFSSEPPGFRTVYAAQARLIRLDDQSVVWQETCQFDRDRSLTPILRKDDLDGAGNVEAVKAAMQILASNCADYLWRQFFRREAGPELPNSGPIDKTTSLK
jgi:hypothetical protein